MMMISGKKGIFKIINRSGKQIFLFNQMIKIKSVFLFGILYMQF